MSSWLPLLPAFLPALSGLAAVIVTGDSRRRGTIAAAGCAAGFLGSAGLALAGTLTGQSLGYDGIAVTLVLLTTGLGAVVLGYAGRYLSAESGSSRFFPAAGLLVSACAGVGVATTLLAFAACWSVAGLALWLLLGTASTATGSGVARRRAVASMVIGEASLWAAVLLIVATQGNVTVGGALTDPGAQEAAAALLLVVAALCRSALIPFHGWLTATLHSPTPVSALLHAGFVNAGAVLILRLEPVLAASAVAVGLALVAGGLSAVLGTVAMLVRPDTKGALAHSTTGQMGFLLFTAALGLPAVALVHLVLHGAYKAAMFLNAGSTVHRQHHAPHAPPAAVRTVVVAVAVGAILLVIHRALPVPHDPASTAMLVFAWAALATASVAAARQRQHALPTVLLLVAIVGGGYLALVGFGHLAIGSDIPTTLGAPALPALATLALVLALAAAVRHRLPLVNRLHARAYVTALALGAARPTITQPPRTRTARPSVPLSTPLTGARP